VKGNCIRIPVGQFFLIRRGRTCGAIKWTKPVLKGDGGYAYKWYYQPDGSGSFTNPAATSGKGKVFTDWRGTQLGPDKPEFFSEEGRDYLQCGGLCVKWALGNWLYFDDYMCAEIEIAVTGTSDISEINYLDSSLTWYGQRCRPPASEVEVWADTGVEVPAGKFFLVRRRGFCAAFRLTRICSRGTRGYEYEGFGRPDSSGRFTGPGSERATGEVFETWEADQGGPSGSTEDDDNAQFLTCGEMQVEWSSDGPPAWFPSWGNLIHFDAPAGDVEIAITGASDIAEVNCLDKSLTWHCVLDGNCLPTEVNDFAVRVPARCFILARNERDCVAFKLDRGWRHPHGYKYVWYWQTGGSAGFAYPGVESGDGEVFDLRDDYFSCYTEYRRLEDVSDAWRDNDDGIRYLICGPLTLKWSLGNWIYFDSPQGRVEIAVTDAIDIQEVNCLDAGLTWHRGKLNLPCENQQEI
jgi:hypothetical protein